MKSRIDQIFTGRVKPMLPDGEPSGIFKSAVDGARYLGANGLEGDEQADLRYHGGPEKALHQYPAEHYALLAQEWHVTGSRRAGLFVAVQAWGVRE